MNTIKVILRADGNVTIGFGHVYRMLAMAEILRDEFECTFVINNPDPFILNEIKKSCSTFVDLKGNHQYKMPDEVSPGDEIDFDMQEYLTGNEIVVTDGYLFGKNYQAAVKLKGNFLVCIDDLATSELYADIVINHAPGIDISAYKVQPFTQLLTGLDYAIIRKPFLRPLVRKEQYKKRKAFISLGGADPYGYSEKLADMIFKNGLFEEFNILCPSSFNRSFIDSLKKHSFGSSKIILHSNLDAEALVNVMDDCTHAFVSSSTVLMESYARGLKCFTGYYVDNHKFMYQGFVKNKLAIGLGDFGLLNSDMMTEAIKNDDELNLLRTSLSSHQNILKSFHSLYNKCN